MVNQLLDNSFGGPIGPFFALRLSKVIRKTGYIEFLGRQVEVFGRDLLFLFNRVEISVGVLSEWEINARWREGGDEVFPTWIL